jgi:hypothetical protein
MSGENMVREVQLDFLIGLSVARDPEPPRWNEGDVFARFAAAARPPVRQPAAPQPR